MLPAIPAKAVILSAAPRKKQSFSQKQLGEKAGLRQETISLIETGNPATRIENLLAGLSALDLEFQIAPRSKGWNKDIESYLRWVKRLESEAEALVVSFRLPSEIARCLRRGSLFSLCEATKLQDVEGALLCLAVLILYFHRKTLSFSLMVTFGIVTPLLFELPGEIGRAGKQIQMV